MMTALRSVLSLRRPVRACLPMAFAAMVLVVLPAVAFSADTVIGTVPVGDSPTAVAVDPVSHHVYVANMYGDSVTVVDGVTHAVEATVPMPTGGSGGFPDAVVADPLTGKAYAGTFWSDLVSVIGPGHSAIATIAPPPSHGSGVRALALDLSGPTTKLYAAIIGKNLVSVIDADAHTVLTNIPVGDSPRALALFASGPRRRLYVANRYTNDVSVVDAVTDSVVATVPTGAGPKAIAVDPGTGYAYVSSPASDTVTVIGDTDAALATIDAGDNPIGIGIDSARRRVFVAAYNEAAVTVIDADTLAVLGRVATGAQPYAVAVDQSAGRVFVSCYGGGVVTAIDSTTLLPVTVPVGYRPYAMAIDEGLAVHKTFVGNWGDDTLSVVDPATGASGAVTATIDPLPGDATSSVSPVLTGSAVSVRAPWPSAIVAVFYRLDGEEAWRRATVTQGAGTSNVRWRTGELGPLGQGGHTIEVAAMDQAMAVASSSDQGSGGASASLGAPGSYTFAAGVQEPVVTRYEESDATKRFGRWSLLFDPRYSHGSALRTQSRGAWIEFTFEGTAVDLIAAKGPALGIAAVSLDGGAATNVDLYAPATVFGARVWGVQGLAEGSHVLRVRCTGARTRPSKGTAIVVDAIDVLGVPAVP